MKRRRVLAMGAIGVLLVAGAMVATGAAESAVASTPSCQRQTDDPWPAYTQGRPAGINPDTARGLYMWHDSGWHIRVTHHVDSLRTFSGELVTKGAFVEVHPVHLEKSDTFSVSKDRHVITFYFKNYGHIDGLDFRTHCAPSIQFSFQTDGHTLAPNKIIIGHDKVHPASDPFSVTRSTPPTSTTTTTTTMKTP